MAGKHYVVRSDLEGVSGVVSYEQTAPGMPEYPWARRMFMQDLVALVEGLNAGGAESITVYDEHYYGRNIDLEELPDNVSLILGKPRYTANWAGGLDSTCAGLILLGFHSKNGSGGLLHHSYEPDICDIALNGRSVGEIGMEAANAGDRGVPLVMVTADSAGVREAEELVPGVVGVSVKESLGASSGICYGTENTGRRIREAATRIVLTPLTATPLRIENPVLRITLNSGAYTTKFCELYQCDNIFELRGKTVTECWAEYWQRKLRTQEALG